MSYLMSLLCSRQFGTHITQCQIESRDFWRKMAAIANIECLGVVLHFRSLKYIIIYSAIKIGPVILPGLYLGIHLNCFRKHMMNIFLKSIAATWVQIKKVFKKK